MANISLQKSISPTTLVTPIILILSVILNIFLGVNYLKQNQKQYFTVSRVIDGDTLELNTGEFIRLLGVDAPEKDRCGYSEAKQELEKLILNTKVTFNASAFDYYKRPVADVYNDKGDSINVLMVISGWAVYDSSDSKDKEAMRKAGETARSKGIGVLSPLCSQTENLANPKCSIKGNYDDSSGKRIYSFPACSHYTKTIVNLYTQDQWFCTEAEAVKAGFVKSDYCKGLTF